MEGIAQREILDLPQAQVSITNSTDTQFIIPAMNLLKYSTKTFVLVPVSATGGVNLSIARVQVSSVDKLIGATLDPKNPNRRVPSPDDADWEDFDVTKFVGLTVPGSPRSLTLPVTAHKYFRLIGRASGAGPLVINPFVHAATF